MLELLMVIVVLGILGAVAIANYRRTVERGYCRVAQDMLLTIHAGERAYYFTHDPQQYYDVNEKEPDPKKLMKEWGKIFMDDPHLKPSIPVTFSVDNVAGTGGAATFRATATRDGGVECPATGSSCGGCALTIDQNRLISGKWGDNKNCCGALSQ